MNINFNSFKYCINNVVDNVKPSRSLTEMEKKVGLVALAIIAIFVVGYILSRLYQSGSRNNFQNSEIGQSNLKQTLATIDDLDYFEREKLDLADFSAKEIEDLSSKEMKKLLDCFPSDTIGENLSKIPAKWYKNLPFHATSKCDVSQLSVEQLLGIFKNKIYLNYSQNREISLDAFTETDLQTLSSDEIKPLLSNLSKETLTQNLSKIPLKYYPDLKRDTVQNLDVTQLSVAQVMALNSSDLTDNQLLKINLSIFSSDEVKKWFEQQKKKTYFNSPLNKLNIKTIKENIKKIPPDFLGELDDTKTKQLDINELSVKQLISLKLFYLKNEQFLQIDLSKFSKDEIQKLFSAHHGISRKLNPKTIKDNSAKLPFGYFQHPEQNQIPEIDLSQFNDDDLKKWLATNSHNIRYLNKNTVKYNFERFPPHYLYYLKTFQVNELDFSKLTVDQLGLLNSSAISDNQILKIDLSKFSKEEVRQLLFRQFSFLRKLHPKTVADNLAKIPDYYYNSFSTAQLNEIDYSKLTPGQKIYFGLFAKQKMKNYKPDPKPQTPPPNYGWNFGTQTGQQPRGAPNFGTGQKPGGTPNAGPPPRGTPNFGARPNPGAPPNAGPQAKPERNRWTHTEEQLHFFETLLKAKEAIVAFNQKNPDLKHPNPKYEAIRTRIVQQFEKIENDPRLFFDENPNNVTKDTVKKLYRTLSVVLHPDKHSGDDVAKKWLDEVGVLFKALSSVYVVVQDEKFDFKTGKFR